jgi:hypothetical protein
MTKPGPALVLVTALGLVAALGLAAAPAARADQSGAPCGKNCKKFPGHALPKSVDEFLALRDSLDKTPYDGAALFVYALMVYNLDEALGSQMLVLALSPSVLTKGGDVYKGYGLNKHKNYMAMARKQAHCIRGYGRGATPDNNYKLDPKKVALTFKTQKDWGGCAGSADTGKCKVFVCNHGGADSCRPLWMERDGKGRFKATKWSSLVTGCRPPAGPDPDAAAADDEL